jgi:hypothetical protein
MMTRRVFYSVLLAMVMLLAASPVQANTVYWTDWTTKSTGLGTGTMNIGSETVGVNFSGTYSFAQTSGGTNYWNPSTPYISATVSNAPPASDIIGLSTGGTATITFSEAVTNPLIALVSWNGNYVDFGENIIKFLSYGHGYWGNGTPVLYSDKTGFHGVGEVHGVLELEGVYTSITFTHTSEGWHGLTVGAMGVAPVPLPGAVWLLGSGLVGLVGLKKKFRK